MKIECYLVQDLLPQYIEDLTSAETNADIKEHMEECEQCKEKYRKMTVDMKIETGVIGDVNLDYLKKIKRNYTKKGVIGIAILGAVLMFYSIQGLFTGITRWYEFFIVCPLLIGFLYFSLHDSFLTVYEKRKDFYLLQVICIVVLALSMYLMMGFSAGTDKGIYFFGIEKMHVGPFMFQSYLFIIIILIVVIIISLNRSLKVSYKYFTVLGNAISVICLDFAYMALMWSLIRIEELNFMIGICTITYFEGLVITFLIGNKFKKYKLNS